MTIARRSLRFGGGFAIVLLSLAGFALDAVSQTGARISVGVTPVAPEQPLGLGHSMIGVQFGLGQNMQQGTYACPCGSSFNSGRGMGWDGSAIFEIPFVQDLFAGLKAGIDRENTSTTIGPENETVIVYPSNASQLDTVELPTNRTGNLTMTLLSFEPFIQYQVLSTNFFIQIGAGISYLISSNFTQTRTLTTSSITLSDGSTINNFTFTNGSRAEEFQYGSLTAAKSLLFSGILSAGYNFTAGRMNFAPIVTYDYPFSSPQSSGTWKIASFYGSLSVGFKLN